MLILNRGVDEGLRIYDSDGKYIGHVMVLGIGRGHVKIGIDADTRFVVLRDELVDPHQAGQPGPAPGTR